MLNSHLIHIYYQHLGEFYRLFILEQKKMLQQKNKEGILFNYKILN